MDAEITKAKVSGSVVFLIHSVRVVVEANFVHLGLYGNWIVLLKCKSMLCTRPLAVLD